MERNYRGVLRDRASPVAIVMSIRRYFKPTNQLPDPRGSLSADVPPATIASANRSASVRYGPSRHAVRPPQLMPKPTCMHHARATCKNIFVQFDLYEIIFTRTFFSRTFTRRKKSELRYMMDISAIGLKELIN